MNTHPALHDPNDTLHPAVAHAAHFVPNGWESTDRGICPCGQAVRWDPEREVWIPDRTLVIFVLTHDEAELAMQAVDDLQAGDEASHIVNEALHDQLQIQSMLNVDPDAAIADRCADCGEPLTVGGEDGGDPVHVFCDICGKAEHPADLTADWNGETGNHRSCEVAS